MANTRASQRRLVIGCVSVYAVGFLAAWLAPQILFGVMRRYGVSAAQAGIVTLVEGVTAGLLSMALGTWSPQITHRRLAMLGLTLVVVTNGIAPWMPEFLPLLGLRFVSGLGDAVLMFVGVSLIAVRVANPDRGYVIMTMVSGLYGALILALLPLFSPAAQGLTYLPFSALATVLIAPLILCIPSDTRPVRFTAQPQLSGAPRVASSKAIQFAVLFAVMVPICTQAFAVVAFSPGVGESLGMSQRAINTTLSGATLASIAGPFVAAAAAGWFGRWKAFFFMAIVLFSADLAVTHTASQGVFVLGLLINQMAAYFFMPLLLGWAADLDHTGRYSSIMIGGAIVMTSLTPTLAGMLIDVRGLAVLSEIVVATGVAFLSLLILLYILSVAKKQLPPAAMTSY